MKATKGRISQWIVGAGALALAGTMSMGCNGDDDPLTCETHEECGEGQFCDQEGFCVEGEPPENQNQNQNQIPDIEDEDYLVSILGRTSTPPVDAVFRVVGSRDESSSTIDPGVDCAVASVCGITADMSTFVVAEDAGGGSLQVSRAPFDPSTMTVGDFDSWLTGVSNVRLRHNGVLFNRVEDDLNVGYYGDAITGEEHRVADLHQVGTDPGRRWDADPVADRAVVYIPTLNSLDFRIGTVFGGVAGSDYVTTFGRENRPGDAGSNYDGEHPAGFSEDGRYVAIRIRTSPNARNNCASDADCTGTSEICGNENRCVALHTAVYVFDMDFAHTIGDSCSSHDDCGPVHRCDSAWEDFQDGTCRAQRTIVGVPNRPSQGSPSREGCLASREDGSYGFTDAVGPLTFGPDGRLYLVAQRNCVYDTATGDDTEANIPASVIIAIDPTTGEYEEIFGNTARENFEEIRCFDVDEQRVDITDCMINIDSARLSPDGNDIVFLGSHPSAGTASLASDRFDVWRVRRDGEDHDWIGRMSNMYPVRHFQVHRDLR